LKVYWRRDEDPSNPGAQPAVTSMVGTVAGFGTGTPSIVVKAENGQSVAAKLTPDTIAQRIAPGEKDLKKAVPVKVSDVAIGGAVAIAIAKAIYDAYSLQPGFDRELFIDTVSASRTREA
jgi:hypothetical protein